MAGEDEWPEFVRSNQSAAQLMYQSLRAGNGAYAQSTARTLLEHAELPLLLRARACLVLACGDVPVYLEMAHEAVRVAEIANNGRNVGEGESQLLRDCQTICRQAQRDFDEAEQTIESELPAQDAEAAPADAALNAADILASNRAAAHDAANLDIRDRDYTT